MENPHYRMLVVDDDPVILDVLTAIASGFSFITVDAASDAEQALDLMNQRLPYDMVITDLVMPGLSGLDVIDAAKQRSSHTTIALVTGFGDLEEAIQAIERGAFGYIHKPFRTEELRLLIRNMVERLSLHGRLNRLSENYRELQAECDDLRGKVKALEQDNQSLREQLMLERISSATGKVVQAQDDREPTLNGKNLSRTIEELEQLVDRRKITREEFNHYRRRLLNQAYGKGGP